MSQVRSDFSDILDIPPSCMEFVPGTREQYLLIGTYFLENPEGSESSPSKPQKRNGSIITMLRDASSLKYVSSLPVDHGVLDLHFSPHQENVFATANSTGSLSFYTHALQESESKELQIKHQWNYQFEPEGVLVLALAWHSSDKKVMGVSLSDGRIVVIENDNGDWNDSQTSSQVQTMFSQAHSLEAWTLSFSVDSQSVDGSAFEVLSGGDDSALVASAKIAQDGEESASLSTTWTSSRLHDAGVTAILPLESDLILTGSYDDHIRVIRHGLSGRRVLADLNLGGGVWRLKKIDLENPSGIFYILASCMYAGCRLVKISEQDKIWQIEVLAKFEEHKSMNYASEALVLGSEIKVISTSFYDKLVCMWSFDTR